MMILPLYADQQHWAAKEAEAQGQVLDSESLFLPSKARRERLIIRGHQGCTAHSQESRKRDRVRGGMKQMDQELITVHVLSPSTVSRIATCLQVLQSTFHYSYFVALMDPSGEQ